jgi:hypothetical protein
MKTKLLTPLALLLLAGRPALAEEKPAPSFARDIMPFLVTYCTDCHNQQVRKSGYDLSDYQGLMKSGKKGAAVVPGKPERSLLLLTMNGGAKLMPPKKYAKKPTPEEVAMVRAWIAAGAKEDLPQARPEPKPEPKPEPQPGKPEESACPF